MRDVAADHRAGEDRQEVMLRAVGDDLAHIIAGEAADLVEKEGDAGDGPAPLLEQTDESEVDDNLDADCRPVRLETVNLFYSPSP